MEKNLIVRIEDRFETVLKVIIIFLFSLLCINVFTQVIFRYVFAFSFRWTIELGRYLMIWVVLLSMGPALKHGVLVGLEISMDKLGTVFGLIIRMLVRAIMLWFSVLMIRKTFEIMDIQRAMEQSSPAMEIPIYLVYASIPFGFAIYIVYLFLQAYHDVRELR